MLIGCSLVTVYSDPTPLMHNISNSCWSLVANNPEQEFITVVNMTLFNQSIFGAWWLTGRFIAFRPKGYGFESRSSCHIGTLGKAFTRSSLWRVSMKMRHSIRAVLGVPLSSSGLERGAIEMNETRNR